MRKLFEQYGGIIVVTIAIVSLIGVVTLAAGGTNGGWIGNAYNEVVDGFASAVEFNEDVGSAVVVTSYTSEEIDSNELLYPIGETDPYYVVAAFNDDYTEVVITKNGEDSDGLMMDWTSKVKSPMRAQASTLGKVTIHEGVASVGTYSFAFCKLINELSLPSTMLEIRSASFVGCIGLTIDLVIPQGTTVIGGAAFNNCSTLKSISIPGTVKTIEKQAFALCSGVKYLTIGEGVENIGDSAFHGVDMSEIVLPDSLKTIGAAAFAYCDKIQTITIPSNVTSVGQGAFIYCEGLQEIIVSEENEKYISIDNCLIDASNKTLMAGCTTSIIPSDGSVTTIDSHAFRGCTNLKALVLPATVTEIGTQAFYECSGLEIISVDANSTVYHSDGNCLIRTDSNSLVLGCRNSVIPTDGSVTNIDDYAFMGCSGITSILIPECVTEIGQGVFNGCTNLTTIQGSIGSYAETWATDNGYTFVAI